LARGDVCLDDESKNAPLALGEFRLREAHLQEKRSLELGLGVRRAECVRPATRP
jgi:hypothetical protein